MSRNLELSHIERKHFTGGSDARVIMGKDENALMRPWRQKRGEAPEVDLSRELIVQVGIVTEDINQAWYEHNVG